MTKLTTYAHILSSSLIISSSRSSVAAFQATTSSSFNTPHPALSISRRGRGVSTMAVHSTNEAATTTTSISSLSSQEILDQYDTFLLDMWGVMHNGSEPYEGVLEAVKELKRAGKKMIILSNSSKRKENSHKMLKKRSAASFILVALMIALSILRYADENKMPLIACIPLSLYGFLIAATWIDSIGGALVDLLQFFGTFLRIPPGILGMTVLAVGNSMGDLSSNLAMARNGLPNMATTAAFAGPAFNLLVGVGCGFLALQRKLDTTVVSPVTLNATIRIGFMFIIVNCIAIALCGISCQWRVPKRYCYFLFAWYALFILIETLGISFLP